MCRGIEEEDFSLLKIPETVLSKVVTKSALYVRFYVEEDF